MSCFAGRLVGIRWSKIGRLTRGLQEVDFMAEVSPQMILIIAKSGPAQRRKTSRLYSAFDNMAELALQVLDMLSQNVTMYAQGCLILKPELTLARNKSLGKCGRSGAKIDAKIL